MDFNETTKFTLNFDKEEQVRQIMTEVYEALKIKGYNPVSQIVGYLMSGDPTYITSYDNARSKICKLERDVLLENIIKSYLQN